MHRKLFMLENGNTKREMPQCSSRLRCWWWYSPATLLDFIYQFSNFGAINNNTFPMTTADEPQRATLHVNLLVRPLAPSDLEKDFVVLLQQLSTVVRVDPVFFRSALKPNYKTKKISRNTEEGRRKKQSQAWILGNNSGRI